MNPANTLISARVPTSRILASDFHAWHAVLNRRAVCHSEAEWLALYPTDEAPLSREVMEKTWEKIFDLETPNSFLSNGGKQVAAQLCVDRIYLSEILHTKPIVRYGRNPLTNTRT